MIKIRQHTPPQISLYHKYEFIGYINNKTELLNVLFDINNQFSNNYETITDYYFIFGKKIIPIDKHGYCGVENSKFLYNLYK